MADRYKRWDMQNRARCKNNYYFLNHEVMQLRKHYDFLSCTLKNVAHGKVLEVIGKYNQVGKEYTYKHCRPVKVD